MQHPATIFTSKWPSLISFSFFDALIETKRQPVGQDGKGEGDRVRKQSLAPLLLLLQLAGRVQRLAGGVHHVPFPLSTTSTPRLDLV